MTILTPAEYAAQLVAVARPLTPEQIEAAARMLAGLASEQEAA